MLNSRFKKGGVFAIMFFVVTGLVMFLKRIQNHRSTEFVKEKTK